MSESLIEVKNIKFAYPSSEDIINRMSFNVKKNEKLAIIGPNGAGKSTLLLLLNGLVHPGEGEIFIDGVKVGPKTVNSIRPKMGLVFQDPDDQLFCPTLYEDLEFGAKYLKKLSGDDLKKQVNYALEKINLTHKKDVPPFHLSFGEKKRAAIGSVLTYKPEILILDEPTSNLDPKNRRSLINFLKEWQSTLLIISHDLDFVIDVCERVIIINKGQITADGNSQTILKDKELLESNDLELPLCLQKL